MRDTLSAISLATHRARPLLPQYRGPPRQVYGGEFTRLARPEDIKVNREQTHIIVSGSAEDTVTYHAFARNTNTICNAAPELIFSAKESRLSFPYGIAISPSGDFLVVTQFGPLPLTLDENIEFSAKTPKEWAAINVYRRQGLRLAGG